MAVLADRPLNELSAADFTPLIGETVTLTLLASGEQVPAELVLVDALRPVPVRPTPGLTAILWIDLPGPLPQSTYRIEHPAIGALHLLMSPADPSLAADKGRGACLQFTLN